MPYRIASLAASHPLALKALAVGYSGAFSAFVGEMITGREVFAAILGVASALITAYFATKPAVMRARIEEHAQEVTEQENSDSRRDRLHARELAFEQRRTQYHIKRENLARRSKHNALNEVNRAYFYIHELQRLMVNKHLDFQEFEFKTSDAICGEEDRQLEMIEPPESIETSGQHSTQT